VGDESSSGEEETNMASGETEAEKELQIVKSNLGRKLAAMEARQKELIDKIETLTSSSNDEDPDDEFEIPTTREEFRAALKREQEIQHAQQQKTQVEYEQKYLGAVDALSGEDEATHDEIYNEMMANFNVKISDNPELDAQLNYAKAEASLLKKKVGTKTNPLKGNNEYSNKQTPQKMVKKTTSTPTKLSGPEAEYARMMGMSEEQIQNAVGKEVPVWQRK